MKDFDSIEYLRDGNARQKRAHHVLVSNSIIQKLQPFDPILTGTIPIDIDIEGSDLDIICYWRDKNLFIKTLTENFSGKESFRIRSTSMRSFETVIVNFFIDPFPIEIFGQNRPAKEQEAYTHMIIESRILEERGESFRQEIIKLKKSGMKTEVAFAKLLELPGVDPYHELLKYNA